MKKSEYIDKFKDKKITIMGLGLLGRGVNVTKFLAECGADLIVTDLKEKKELTDSLDQLKKYKNIEYVFGRHRFSEFEGRDMIIKAASVPKDSKYLERAREDGATVEMDASLFARLAPAETKLIGVTGTRGKSTVTHLVCDILKAAGKRVHIGGNVKGQATLPLLKDVKPDDFVVLELDSWQLQGFGEAKISPQYAIFTNLMEDHQDYYKNMREYFKDKANIFLYQTQDDYLITTADSFKAIQKYYGERAHKKVKGTMAMAKPKILLDDYQSQLVGEHNRQNIAAAVQLADLLRIDSSISKKAVANFKPLDGRLQYVRKILDRSIYNDNNATTPDATVAAVKSIKGEMEEGDITLIMGGSDKGLDTTELERVIKRHVGNVVLIPGTGTDQIRFKLYDDDDLNIDETETIHDALELAIDDMSAPGDSILFSPGFASFDQFANAYEREEAFLEAVDDLKR